MAWWVWFLTRVSATVLVCQIVANNKYNNFIVDYHYPDWVGYINKYVAGGGTAEDLIE